VISSAVCLLVGIVLVDASTRRTVIVERFHFWIALVVVALHIYCESVAGQGDPTTIYQVPSTSKGSFFLAHCGCLRLPGQSYKERVQPGGATA